MDMDMQYANRRQDDLVRVNWPHFACKRGDTLVIVHFPSNGTWSCNNSTWSGTKRLFMNRARLLATGSTVFADGFSDANQRRYRRRNQLETLPDGVKYVLDMTPSLEGDNAAFLVSELSVPAGARDWWMSKERLGVASSLVSGHDDVCEMHHLVPDDCKKDKDWNPGSHINLDNARKWHIYLNLDSCRPCTARKIQDYCAVRHRANIIRLLLAIDGHDLVLNSAPRVYTISALAKQLDIVDLVSSPVRAWLEDHRNGNFVDIHPEITIEMAWKLKLQEPVRSALRILVLERAFEPAGDPIKPITRFGRPRSDLSDDISEVVQHATNSLRERLNKAAADLFSPRAYEWLQIPAWDEFLEIGRLLEADIDTKRATRSGEEFQLKIVHAWSCITTYLRDYIRDVVNDASNAPLWPEKDSEIDNDRLAYTSEITPFLTIRHHLSKEQKMLMPLFWKRLMDDTQDWRAFCTYKPDPWSAKLLGVQVNDLVTDVNWALSSGAFPSLLARYPFGLAFGPKGFHDQLGKATQRVRREWAPHYEQIELPLQRTTHLALGLTDDEFKFLPLWAGGLDDGTGGVFHDTVPDTDMGPSQPGPAYHTGKTIAAPSSTADSDITVIGGGMSLRAVQSGTGSTTASFVDVASSLGVRSMEDASSDMHDGTTSVGDALEQFGIFSDSGKSDAAELEESVANTGDDDGSDETSSMVDASDDDSKMSATHGHDEVVNVEDGQDTAIEGTTEGGENTATKGVEDISDGDDCDDDTEDEWSDLG